MIMRLILLPLFCVMLLMILSHQLHAEEQNRLLTQANNNSVEQLIHQADQHIAQAQYEQALNLLHQAYENSQTLNDTSSLNDILNSIAHVYYNTGQLEQAHRFYNELVTFDRQHNDQAALSTSLYNLGHVNASRKEFALADNNFTEALELSRLLADDIGIASTLKALGVNAQAQSKLSVAKQYLTRALHLFDAIQNKSQSARVQRHLGDIAHQQRDDEQAIQHYLAALSVLQEYPFSKALMRTHQGLSKSYQSLGDFSQALTHQQHYSAIQQQLLTQQNKEATQRLQVQFETQRFAAENEQLMLLNEQQETELAHRQTRLKMQYALLILILAILILIAILWSRSKKHAQAMQQLATKDDLTGLKNRRALMQFAMREWHRATRFNRAYCCIAIDIDHFKNINDTWGHATGDAVLKQIATTIQSSLRITDNVGRIGGEEFLVISIESEIKQAMALAERIRQKIETIRHPHQAEKPITVSIGVAELNDKTSLEDLIAQADKALYTAKNNGRNQVTRYQAAAT